MQQVLQHQGLKHWSVAMLLMLCVVLAFIDKISIAVLFSNTEFVTDFAIGSDKAKQGLLMSVFLLAYGLSSITLSWLGDLFSPSKLLMCCVGLWGLLMLAMGLSTSFAWLIFWRVLLGITEGPLLALAYSIVKHSYAANQQARASTLFLLGTPIGASIGFPMTAYILHQYNWQATFFFMASLSLLLLLILLIGLRHLAPSIHKRKKPQFKLGDLHYDKNIRLLFFNYKFWLLCFFNIAFMSYLWGLNSWVPNYLIENKNFSLKLFGWFSALPFIGMLCGEILGAMYADRTGKRAMQAFLGLLLAGIFIYLMMLANAAGTIMLMMSLSATAWGVASSAVLALLASLTRAEISATAGGIFNGLGNVSSALLPFAIGVMVQITGEFDYGIACIAIISILGAFLLLPLFSSDKNALIFKSIKE